MTDDEDKADGRARLERFRIREPYRDLPKTPADRRASHAPPEMPLAAVP